MGRPGILSRTRRERNPPLELGGGNGAPLDVGGTLVLPLNGDRYVGELLELQQGCEAQVPTWCESILGLKLEAVQGIQVSLEWTETSGGLWEWWHDPGVPLAFPVESASS